MSTVIAAVVVKYVLYAAIIAAVGFGVPFAKRAYAWILSKIPANYRPLLETWAKEAVSYAQQYISGAGEVRFAGAVQQVLAIVSHHKLNIPLQEVQGAIQDAYNQLKKSGDLPKVPTPAPTPTPTPAATTPSA